MFGWLKKKPNLGADSVAAYLEPLPVTRIVNKKTKSGGSVWLDIATDIEEVMLKQKEQKPELMMPMLYAYRAAMAGRFVRAEITKDDYAMVCTTFLDMGKRTALIFTKKGEDEQAHINFQNKARYLGLELLNSYDININDLTIGRLIATANNNIILTDALYEWLVEELGYERRLECEIVSKNHTTPKFCIEFLNQLDFIPQQNNRRLIVQELGRAHKNGRRVGNNYAGSPQVSKVFVEAISKLGAGSGHLWEEILYDVEKALAGNKDGLPLSLSVAAHSARVIAVAGLFLERKSSTTQYKQATKEFQMACNHVTGLMERGAISHDLYHVIMSDSLIYCAELICSYGFEVDSNGVRDIMALAEDEVDLAAQLHLHLTRTDPDHSKQSGLEECRQIVTTKFILDFINGRRWWSQDDGLLSITARVGSFYKLTQ